MARSSHRERLTEAGLAVVHARGYHAAGVRAVVAAAGVPQGSFTNHFSSKEQFGLAVLDRFFSGVEEVIARTLLAEPEPGAALPLPPEARLRAYPARSGRVRARPVPNGC